MRVMSTYRHLANRLGEDFGTLNPSIFAKVNMNKVQVVPFDVHFHYIDNTFICSNSVGLIGR